MLATLKSVGQEITFTLVFIGHTLFLKHCVPAPYQVCTA